MKRKVLAILVPALLMAGAANAAEIYNKNGNKVEFYGKMVGERIWTDTDTNNSENADTSYARFGVKGETQINTQLTGYGQFEYNIDASEPEGSQDESTRLAFAGLKYADNGSFDYGRNYGVAYDAAAYTDMLVEWGGDSWASTDNFMTQRTNGVATYRNTDFFGMVEGLNFAVQYQGKNNDRDLFKSNGDGYSMSVNYNVDGFGFVGTYGKSDRTDEQTSDGYGDNAEVWALSAKYDANNVYAAVMYGETRNMTKAGTNRGFANKTQNVEAVVQYQFDFGLRPSLGYVYSQAKDFGARNGYEGINADRVNYIELGTWYYFNKNMNVYTAYKFNLLNEDDAAITGNAADDQFAMGIVYQF
ncbi:porin [Enterobacter hormaechei]|uniref:porin n=1 Tax=Enterobacter hormaechei TaxID=158836 RepID=UPI001866FA8C|nr:porin [Enterobacter hormaechei]MBF1960517.1 porin [Enterobacter hormaechei]MBF1981546.1 porin [Enterobacter hormaechei]MDK3077820.1 porin [Enterobacter hormaechei]